MNQCETQDDHCCDHFEEGMVKCRVEIIKRPKKWRWTTIQQGDSASLTPLLVEDEPIRSREKKWDNMRAEQEAYEHLNPAEVE